MKCPLILSRPDLFLIITKKCLWWQWNDSLFCLFVCTETKSCKLIIIIVISFVYWEVLICSPWISIARINNTLLFFLFIYLNKEFLRKLNFYVYIYIQRLFYMIFFKTVILLDTKVHNVTFCTNDPFSGFAASYLYFEANVSFIE